MVEIEVAYTGELHCRASHGPSGVVLDTDAPVDNQGRGESFSPTDLVATALGTCMLTTMGIVARREGYPFGEVRMRVRKHMTQAPPRRIERLEVEAVVAADVAAALSADARAALEHAAHTCPVRLSLLDAIEVPVCFDWQG